MDNNTLKIGEIITFEWEQPVHLVVEDRATSLVTNKLVAKLVDVKGTLPKYILKIIEPKSDAGGKVTMVKKPPKIEF